MTFSEALADALKHTDRQSVLLGNGFSKAYDNTAFSYERLRDATAMPALSIEKDQLFALQGDADFEKVIAALEHSASLAGLYGPSHKALADRMRGDANAVRDGLAEALAKLHPTTSKVLTAEEVESTREFLANFGTVFTVNYDLLLYWVIAKSGSSLLARYDGFGNPAPGIGTLVWKEGRVPQHLHFLHGAMHLFNEDGPDGPRLTKLPGAYGTLVGQIGTKIAAGHYPVVVTEGTEHDKLAKIVSSPYLRYCLQALVDAEGSLFVQGMGLKDNDDHIRNAIALAHFTRLYVSLHSSSNSSVLKAHAHAIAERRSANGGPPLEVFFYEAGTAALWLTTVPT